MVTTLAPTTERAVYEAEEARLVDAYRSAVRRGDHEAAAAARWDLDRLEDQLVALRCADEERYDG